MRTDVGESEAGLVKVVFELEEGGFERETLWAEPLNSDLYRLHNVPFYAYGFSVEDVVSTVRKDGCLTVTGVARRGGHSTYRIFLPEKITDDKFTDEWTQLSQLGCTYERATARYVAIDVPPEADIYAVYSVLEDGERSQRWTFEEGHCGHPLRHS